MTLTRLPGPLARSDDQLTNYTIDGPAHRLLMHPFPRRVRAELAGETLLATRNGVLVHETGLPNRYYLPESDMRTELLTATDTRTVCPYKGWASYWTLTVDGRDLADVAWGYQTPLDESARIKGYRSFLHDELTTEVDGQPL